ncbi:N-acetylmuramoyl-L-alanine amidase [Bacillus sp. BGMRC 2118]|nr:N-acetylmuramoyl-L-alanine amidase [Bacillus sp. BGMRC 2118]
MKLYLDPGHGGTDPGAQGNGLLEKDINLDIALRIRSILLNSFENVEVLMSRSNDQTKSLSERTSEANSWGASFYLSIHCNAFNGTARGYEDYIHNSLPDNSVTAIYQKQIHEEVVKGIQLQDRGMKKANFHVLRETSMPAFLSENGFIDNPNDAALMSDAAWREKVALGHVNGLAKSFNLQRKQASNPDVLYKVISGSFKTRENAEERLEFLKLNQISSFITTTIIDNTTYYRVQSGAYSDQVLAEKQVERIKESGISDAYYITVKADSSTTGSNNETTPTTNSILGKPQLTAEQLDKFVRKVNPKAPKLAEMYISFGNDYGVKGDVAFAQAIHETNYFRFTGEVKDHQNNYAGLGASVGTSFKTPKDGVLAHLQHLYAYATTKPLPTKHPITDTRLKYVERGSAPTWPELNGKWAASKSYGETVLSLYEKMKVSR